MIGLLTVVAGLWVSGDAVNWTTNYDVAVKRAEKTKERLVMVLFTDPVGCPPCRQMEATTFNDKVVQAELKSFVCCKIIVTREHGKEILARFSEWGQPVQAWPTVRFFKNERQVLAPRPGYIAPADFVKLLREAKK